MKHTGSRAMLCIALVMAVLGAGRAEAAVTRDAYIQMGSPSAMTIRWRTDVSETGRVWYGTVSGSLTSIASEGTATTEHSIRITGLSANTRYYYAIGNTGGTQYTSATDTSYTFKTSPTAGSTQAVRAWVIGDAGTGSSSQSAVRDAFNTFNGSTHVDVWLQLGDNAYSSGTDAEYQSKCFNMYPNQFRKWVCWPTRGNHEATDSSGSVYYNNFTLPTAAEAGGTASGTEHYYSYNYANIHFICLDSQGESRSSTGNMANWLRNDLTNNTQLWIVAYFHHPPYTKGSHNSDSESQLIEMRSNIVPILEDYGVDLVLCGHSHSYERSYLIDGHYGLSTTFNSSHQKDAGSGRDSTPYQKANGPHNGAVYAVAGSSGQTSGGTLNHPAHYISLNTLGSMVLDFNNDRLDAKMLNSTGGTSDWFTIIKGTPTPPAAPTNLTATAGDAQVSLTWTASAGASSYNVKRSTTSGGPYTTVATGVMSTSYTNTGLTNGTTYYFVVSAVNTAGESGNSNQASATPAGVPPAAPTNLVATAGDAQVGLTWTASAGASSYNVKRSTTSGGPYATVATGVTGTSYTNTGLTNGTTYYFVVSAVNAYGESGNSNQASATPSAATPTTISFQNGVLPTTSYAGNTDTAIKSGSKTTNYGSNAAMDIDGSPDQGGLMKWDISAIPAGKTITAASIVVDVFDVSSHTYEIYECKRAWTESGATWNQYASGSNWQTGGGSGTSDKGSTSFGAMTSTTTGVKTFTLNSSGLTLIQAWVNGTTANNGFIILDYSVSDGLDFRSSEYSTPGSRPKLVITYQ